MQSTTVSSDSFAKHDKQATPRTSLDAEQGTTELFASKHGLHQELKARHLSMIALGGALGSGLLITTGSALAKGGPAALLICYCLLGFLVLLVLSAIGEMATWKPLASGFTGYATTYVDPALGFALGYW